jgi:IS1 family transposase
MNKLSTEKRAQILHMLVEGNSLRATARMAGVAYNTVLKMVTTAGRACAEYQDQHLRDLPCRKLQLDEIWSFVYAKARNVPENKMGEAGDVWTWTAICADTKLIPSWFLGGRDFEHANLFLKDLRSRLFYKNIQITTDGHRAYIQAVKDNFGADVDYAMLVKVYGEAAVTERRYSPGVYVRSYKEVIRGAPDPDNISTSYAERQNLTMRMSMRRFTRLTNAFSKKVENHYYALALHFMNYNFCRIHQTLRVTPAMAADVSKTIWSMEDLSRMIGRWDGKSIRFAETL